MTPGETVRMRVTRLDADGNPTGDVREVESVVRMTVTVDEPSCVPVWCPAPEPFRIQIWWFQPMRSRAAVRAARQVRYEVFGVSYAAQRRDARRAKRKTRRVHGPVRKRAVIDGPPSRGKGRE